MSRTGAAHDAHDPPARVIVHTAGVHDGPATPVALALTQGRRIRCLQEYAVPGGGAGGSWEGCSGPGDLVGDRMRLRCWVGKGGGGGDDTAAILELLVPGLGRATRPGRATTTGNFGPRRTKPCDGDTIVGKSLGEDRMFRRYVLNVRKDWRECLITAASTLLDRNTSGATDPAQYLRMYSVPYKCHTSHLPPPRSCPIRALSRR